MFRTARRMESVFYLLEEKWQIERTHTRLEGVAFEKFLMFTLCATLQMEIAG